MSVSRKGGRSALAGIAACALLAAGIGPAAAQGLFEQLFGGLARAFAPPPRESVASVARAPDPVPTRRSESGPARAFCVRTCDGHYFPVLADGRTSAAAACQAACPAAETKLYSGSNIDYATARDGSRYADLTTAFLYRKQLVAGCTCNGRTAFGLASAAPEHDSTLRPGDVVATSNGLMAVSASGQLTPAASYAGFSPADRARFSQMKVAPSAGGAPGSVAASSVGEKSTALNSR